MDEFVCLFYIIMLCLVLEDIQFAKMGHMLLNFDQPYNSLAIYIYGPILGDNFYMFFQFHTNKTLKFHWVFAISSKFIIHYGKLDPP